MKLIARDIMKHDMKQGDPKAAWYFFNLWRKLLTNCSFKKKKIQGNSLFWTFQHFPPLSLDGEISACSQHYRNNLFLSKTLIQNLKGYLGKCPPFSQQISVLFFKVNSVFQVRAIQLLAYFTGPLTEGGVCLLRNCGISMELWVKNGLEKKPFIFLTRPQWRNSLM